MEAIFFNKPFETTYIPHILQEIYIQKVYDPFLVGKSGLVILDIGAYCGMTAYHFSTYAKTVYAVEPSFEHFDILAKMLVFNKIDNVVAINKAIWLEEKDLPLYHNKNKTMFSLHGAVNDDSSKPENVSCITFDKLFEEHKIKHIDLMKLDVEGSEVELLSGEGFDKVTKKIDNIILETHQWNDRHPNQVVSVLKSHGYEVGQIKSTANLLVAKR